MGRESARKAARAGGRCRSPTHLGSQILRLLQPWLRYICLLCRRAQGQRPRGAAAPQGGCPPGLSHRLAQLPRLAHPPYTQNTAQPHAGKLPISRLPTMPMHCHRGAHTCGMRLCQMCRAQPHTACAARLAEQAQHSTAQHRTAQHPPARSRRKTRASRRSSSFASSGCSWRDWREGASGSSSLTMPTAAGERGWAKAGQGGVGSTECLKGHLKCLKEEWGVEQTCKCCTQSQSMHPAAAAAPALPLPPTHPRRAPQSPAPPPRRPGAAACLPTRRRCWPGAPGAPSPGPRPQGTPARPQCAHTCTCCTQVE